MLLNGRNIKKYLECARVLKVLRVATAATRKVLGVLIVLKVLKVATAATRKVLGVLIVLKVLKVATAATFDAYASQFGLRSMFWAVA